MPTYRFERVPLTATKSVPCAGGCGRKVRRQRTFEQTINPFNKHADGIPKSRTDILRELKAKADAWQAEPETHPKCEAGGPVPDADRLTAPWHVEECSDEHMENCPCIVAARINGRVLYVADGETPELAARIVADHNAALTAAKPSADMALAAQLTERLAALQDGNEGAYRELYEERRGPHFCPGQPFGQTATAEQVTA